MNGILFAAADAVSAVTQAAEHLEGKTDRYWFLVALLVLGAFAVIALRFLVQQNAELVKQLREEQTGHEDRLTEILREVSVTAQKANESREHMAVCLAQNTEMGNRNAEVLGRCVEQLRRLEG